MLKKTFIPAIFMLVLITVQFATDLTGHWTGKINDQFDVAYDFKADGAKLTGTTKGPDGAVIEIKDGVIKGDSVSFNLPLMDNIVPIKGAVKGDVMSLSMSFNGNAMNFDLKKQVN